MKKRILAVVVVLVVAGCSSPVGQPSTVTDTLSDGSPTEVETPAQTTRTTTDTSWTPGVNVRGGELPINGSLVYERVQQIMGVSGRTVSVQLIEPPTNGHPQFTEFEQRVGFVHTDSETWGVGGGSSRSSIVLWITEEAKPSHVERVLAHELAHTLQWNAYAYRIQSNPWENYSQTYDYRRARQAMVEGVATYVDSVYAERYLGESDGLRLRHRAYDNSTSYEKYLQGLYYFGARYIDHFARTPSEIPAVLNDAPWTTEQVIHNYSPAQELPAPIHVDADAPPGWEENWKPKTFGELFVRVALDRSLSDARVDRAATGWGNDELRTYENDSAIGHIWILRWDTSNDATEFESAWRDHLDHRGTQLATHSWVANGTSFRVERLDAETVVVYMGTEAFVENASVSTAD